MKRKLEHLHFEEAQTGEAMLSELESTDSPASTLAKLQALCCDNCALFMSELLTSSRARLLDNLRRVVEQESKDSSNSAPNTAVIVDLLSQFGDRVSTVGLPSAISLDLGDFVGYVAEATCKDNVERLNDVITFIASTLHAFEMSRHKKMFGERLMGHLLSCIKASRCSVDSNSVNAMKVIRYITTKCAENSRLLISLDGHGAIADVLKDHSSPPIVRRCACGVLANLCTADHSMTDYFMVVIKHIYDFVWEHNEDVKVCYMGCLALFALVESSPDNRIALYWQAGEFLARRIKRIHCTDEVIFVLCSGILTMLGQINLFWNIHAGHGETMELMKSIFVVLNKPSAYNMKLVVYGLEVLKSLVISDDPDFYFGRLIFMHRKNWFDILKQFATRSECEESVRAIMEWAHETESKNEDKEQ